MAQSLFCCCWKDGFVHTTGMKMFFFFWFCFPKHGSRRIIPNFWFPYSYFRNRKTNISPSIPIHRWGKELISSQFMPSSNCGLFLMDLFSRLPSPGATHLQPSLFVWSQLLYAWHRGRENGTESQNNVQKNYSWLRCEEKLGVQLKVVIKLMIQSLYLKKKGYLREHIHKYIKVIKTNSCNWFYNSTVPPRGPQ